MSLLVGDENSQQSLGRLVEDLPSVITAAHELKSPLSLVRQLSLSLESDDLTEAEKRRVLQQIILTSDRALRLTNDLTRTVRLNDNLFELEPINPKQLCQDVVKELKPLFSAYDRKIKFVSTNSQALMVANRDLLTRIIIGFSDNALYYAEGSKVVEIKIGSVCGGDKVRLSVRDYGPKLSKKTFVSLKNKLMNLPTPMHSRPQSSGLGIYIASRFAEAMNGEIGFIRHRSGITFYIDLYSSTQLKLL